jgi:hypothetical protein
LGYFCQPGEQRLSDAGIPPLFDDEEILELP